MNLIERPGQDIVVKVDVTANHKVGINKILGFEVTASVQGYFTFKMCANNNTDQDPRQECFDK